MDGGNKRNSFSDVTGAKRNQIYAAVADESLIVDEGGPPRLTRFADWTSNTLAKSVQKALLYGVCAKYTRNSRTGPGVGDRIFFLLAIDLAENPKHLN